MSPDGRWKVATFSRRCGVLSSPQTGVSLFEHSDGPEGEYPNVFGITYSASVQPEDIDAVLRSVHVGWTSDSTITIEYDRRAKILYQVARLSGLSVTYKEAEGKPR
jgi:hypothetical protein